MLLLPPILVTSLSCRTRSSFDCMLSGSSPISSSSIVPPSAASNKPILPFGSAPVKAPFSYPNSSDSIRVSGRALQLTLINGAFFLSLLLTSISAISSLPHPDSPHISTVTLRSATLCTMSTRAFIFSLLYMSRSALTPLTFDSNSDLASYLFILCSAALKVFWSFSSSEIFLSVATTRAILPFSKYGMPVHSTLFPLTCCIWLSGFPLFSTSRHVDLSQ